jgi:hypothetical protein
VERLGHVVIADVALVAVGESSEPALGLISRILKESA